MHTGSGSVHRQEQALEDVGPWRGLSIDAHLRLEVVFEDCRREPDGPEEVRQTRSPFATKHLHVKSARAKARLYSLPKLLHIEPMLLGEADLTLLRPPHRVPGELDVAARVRNQQNLLLHCY